MSTEAPVWILFVFMWLDQHVRLIWSSSLNSLSLFPGADPHKENFEPLFFREEDCCDEEREEEDEDEGYIPGTTPLSMAASTQVQKLVN